MLFLQRGIRGNDHEVKRGLHAVETLAVRRHPAEGRRLLEFALQKTPLQEAQLRTWIQQQLGAAGN